METPIYFRRWRVGFKKKEDFIFQDNELMGELLEIGHSTINKLFGENKSGAIESGMLELLLWNTIVLVNDCEGHQNED